MKVRKEGIKWKIKDRMNKRKNKRETKTEGTQIKKSNGLNKIKKINFQSNR